MDLGGGHGGPCALLRAPGTGGHEQQLVRRHVRLADAVSLVRGGRSSLEALVRRVDLAEALDLEADVALGVGLVDAMNVLDRLLASDLRLAVDDIVEAQADLAWVTALAALADLTCVLGPSGAAFIRHRAGRAAGSAAATGGRAKAKKGEQ